MKNLLSPVPHAPGRYRRVAPASIDSGVLVCILREYWQMASDGLLWVHFGCARPTIFDAATGIEACRAIARFCAERPHACSAVPALRLPIERAIRAIAATCVIISKGT